MIATITSWPEAFVAAVGLVCLAIVLCVFMIAGNDSKFPWEK